MVARVAINGLGRIGRATLKSVLAEPLLELVAVNDVAPIDNLAYLLRYDTAYGRSDSSVTVADSMICVADRRIKVFDEADPGRLPWRDLDVDLVFECTGVFRKSADLRAHLGAGARRVILSAPAKDELTTIVCGVNEHDAAGQDIISCASCTTNCIAPVMEILHRGIGIRKATMTTVHAYTSSQKLVDGPASKWRRGRAAGANIIPTTTGAAEATGRVVPAVAGHFDETAVRVPFRTQAASERYRGVIGVSEEPIVSADIIADPRASVVDATLTTVTDGDLVKIMAWYDNEWGYAQQMIRQALMVVGKPATTG